MIIFKRIYHYVGFWKEGSVNGVRFLVRLLADFLFFKRRETQKVFSRGLSEGLHLFPKISEDYKTDFCIACTHCAQSCPTGALEWSKKGELFLQLDLCTRCNICSEVCPKDWIDLAGALDVCIVKRSGLRRKL